MTKSKTPKTTEYQIRCSAEKHRTHKFKTKTDKKKAEESLKGLDEHAEKHAELYYSDCAPYKMFKRTITEWEEV